MKERAMENYEDYKSLKYPIKQMGDYRQYPYKQLSHKMNEVKPNETVIRTPVLRISFRKGIRPRIPIHTIRW